MTCVAALAGPFLQVVPSIFKFWYDSSDIQAVASNNEGHQVRLWLLLRRQFSNQIEHRPKKLSDHVTTIFGGLATVYGVWVGYNYFGLWNETRHAGMLGIQALSWPKERAILVDIQEPEFHGVHLTNEQRYAIRPVYTFFVDNVEYHGSRLKFTPHRMHHLYTSEEVKVLVVNILEHQKPDQSW